MARISVSFVQPRPESILTQDARLMSAHAVPKSSWMFPALAVVFVAVSAALKLSFTPSAFGLAFASVLLVADNAEDSLDAVRMALGEAGGASAFDGKLFCRILAADGLALRKILVPVMAALRGGAPAPRLWTV